MELPPPPTVDDLARQFALPVVGFAPQASLSELGGGSTGRSRNGGQTVITKMGISYTLWRNPADHDDPVNLAELSDSMREALAMPPVQPLPEWMTRQRDLMRYPVLWEAVYTSLATAEQWETPELTLVEHLNNILTNSFRETRVVGGFPGQLDSPVTEKHIERVPVSVDGIEIPGMRIDTDPDAYAVGALVSGRILTAVIPREHLPYLTVAFATRPTPL